MDMAALGILVAEVAVVHRFAVAEQAAESNCPAAVDNNLSDLNALGPQPG